MQNRVRFEQTRVINNATYSRGSAITETVVIALTVILIFMMLVTLAKIADFNSVSAQAVHFAAWESAILEDKSEMHATQKNKINSWILSDDDSPIISTVEDDSKREKKKIWNLPYKLGRDGEPELYSNNYSDIEVSTQEEALPNGAAQGIMAGIRTGLTTLEYLSKGKTDLGQYGMERTDINLTINSAGLLKNRSCSNQNNSGSDLCIKRHLVLLSDMWVASGPDEVKEQTVAMVPTKTLEPIGDVYHYLGILPIFDPAKKLKPSIGIVKPDEIPPDRLSQ